MESALHSYTAAHRCLPVLLLAVLLLGAGCATLPPPADPMVTPMPDPPAEALVPRFVDVTAERGLDGIRARVVNWLDADGDGWPDLLVDGARLFRNSGPPDFRFTDVTDAFGLSGGRGGAALCFDLDNDGWTDIATTRGRLWRNEGGRGFRDVAADVGWAPHAKAGVLGCGDVSGNGFADIYVAMQEDWNDGNPTYYPHQLWLNEGGTRFREVAEQAGVNRATYGRAVLFADVDGDGRQDIFVGNYRLQPNLLWQNLGDGRFRDVAERFGVTGRKEPDRYLDPVRQRRYGPHWGHTIGACWLDFDNDGRLDLFTANLVHKYIGPSKLKNLSYDIRGYVCDDSAIYRRTPDRFEDWREHLEVPLQPMGGPGVFKGDELWAGCIPGDANNDGWPDVFVPQVYNLDYARAKLFLNAGGQRFEDRAEAAGIHRIDTYAGAWADIDGDGWLDLVTAGRPGKGAPPGLCLYRNTGVPGTGAEPLRWIKVRLRQGESRRTLLGARVRVSRGSLVSYQEFTAGSSSYGQQNEPTLHFGLGRGDGPVAVEVRWPDGTTDTIEAQAGQTIEFTPAKSGPAAARGRDSEIFGIETTALCR